MEFDKEDHKEIVMDLLNKANFKVENIGVVIELKKAIEGAKVKKDKDLG